MATTSEKPKIFELSRYSLFAPAPENRQSSMRFGIRDGYPRISVFTSIESDKDGKGVISIGFDIDHFLMFLSRLEKVARHDGETKEKITVRYKKKDARGNPTDELETGSELWYGKDGEGIVWLSVVQTGRPRIMFKVTMSDFHEFFNFKGERLTASEASVLRTLTLAGVLRCSFTTQFAQWRDTTLPREGAPRKNNAAGVPATGAFADEDIGF